MKPYPFPHDHLIQIKFKEEIPLILDFLKQSGCVWNYYLNSFYPIDYDRGYHTFVLYASANAPNTNCELYVSSIDANILVTWAGYRHFKEKVIEFENDEP